MEGLDVRWPFLWLALASALERGAHLVAGEDESLYFALVTAAADCRHVASRG